MHKLINISLRAAAAILAVILVASCVFEKENPISKQKTQNVLVQIGVSTNGMVQTKSGEIIDKDANGNDLLADGEGAEIKISTLRVYAYIDGILSGYAYVPEYSSTSKIYMDLKNLPSYGEADVTFVAVANERSMKQTENSDIEVGTNDDGSIQLSPNFGLDSFNEIIYTIANQEFTTVEGDKKKVVGIPMYCVVDKKINVDEVGDENTGDHKGHFIIKEPVSLQLTRSLAKIEVYAAESTTETAKEATNITITGVSFANVPQSSNLFNEPSSTAELSYYEGYIDVATLNEGVVGSKVSSADSNSDNYTPVSNAFYLAENNQGSDREYFCGTTDYTTLSGDDATKATILRIAYTLGNDENDKTIKYGYVKMPKIQRNTCYKVLARIKANGKIDLTLNVLPWEDNGTQEIVFSDNVSLNGDITIEGQGTYNEEKNTFTYNSTNASSVAECAFVMDAPKGGSWYVTLADGDINSFRLETEVNGVPVAGQTVSGPIIPGTLVSVKVITLEDNYLKGTKTVNLQVVAQTLDGRTLLVRHGENDAVFTIVQPQN